MGMTQRATIAGVLTLSAVLSAGWGRAQSIPDLTQSQTLGVDESKFFYLGPTGMKGWMYWSSLTTEARQILVTEVRAGTPAAGVMQYHDVILGIGGGLFTNDARVAFCDAVNDAEATGHGGHLHLTVFRPSTGQTNTLMVQLQEMGTLSPTSPYQCPKVDAMLTNFCEYVYNNGPVGGPTELPSVWAMMASGVPKYVNWATNWIMSQSWATKTDRSVYRDTDLRTWHSGYQLVTLCQYYLLASNSAALPAIADLANFIAEGQDVHGLWGHTMAWPARNGGELHGTLPGYGALNQAGLVALYGLVLARKCGVSDPQVDAAVQKAAAFFRAHMYIGAINYGYHPPVPDVVDSNGRMGIAAHLFRALGDPEAAKWFTMMTSTYGWRDWGHTGNEFNHCWGPMAAGVGGPTLASWLHHKEWYRVSLTMRRQPEGTFKSQGQEGRGEGRQSSGVSGGHATGGYAVQLAANRAHIEITGAGYDTNLYWLSEAEMEEVIFAQQYEPGSSSPEGLTTSNLLAHLDTFCPKVATKIADVLATRVATDPSLLATLVSIVEDNGAPDRKRVAALKALGSSNTLVKATVDTWYAPTNGYVLNWGAANYGPRDAQSWTNILAAITQFDPSVPFDMLTAAQYSQIIYAMDSRQLDAAGSNLYYDAAAVILDPDVGGGWWVSGQNVKNWDPLLLARYADKILRSAEQYAMPYAATDILKHNQIGEGLHSAMVRSSEYWVQYGPSIDTAWMDEYGEHWSWYSNYTQAIKSYYAHNRDYSAEKHIVEFICTNPAPPLKWFRYLIATNLANAVTNPATQLADLRYLMTLDADDDLFHAVCLDRIVAHPDNADPFGDLLAALGSTVPIVGSHWRQYAGAVELGIASTNSTARWLSALEEAASNGNERAICGILHVLAGKNAPEALAAATNYLRHANDYVAMAALDVLAHVGTKDELLTVFENYLTNSTMAVTSEDGTSVSLGFKTDYWLYANWAAIRNIVSRDYAGCLALADALAAKFNAFTANGTEVSRVPYRSLARTPPFSILNPTLSQREVLGFGNGIYAVLGLFARDNANCRNALIQVHNNNEDSYYGRGHDFTACEALLKNFTVPEIVAIENAGGTSLWNERAAMYYLLDRLLSEEVAVSNQLDVLELRGGKYQNADSFYYGTTYQLELNYRRGLEEKDGVHFFYLK